MSGAEITGQPKIIKTEVQKMDKKTQKHNAVSADPYTGKVKSLFAWQDDDEGAEAQSIEDFSDIVGQSVGADSE